MPRRLLRIALAIAAGLWFGDSWAAFIKYLFF